MKTNMNIVINALTITSRHKGGKTYIVNLVNALVGIDKKNKYYIIVNKNGKTLFKNLNSAINFKVIVMPISGKNKKARLFFDHIILPLWAYLKSIDILLYPNNIGPLINIIPYVVVVHDLGCLNIYKTISRPRQLYYKLFFTHSLKKSSCIITVSRFTKNSILKNVKSKLPKILVVYEGVNPIDFPPSNKSEFNYILFVGTLYQHKNISSLISAFSWLKNKYNIKHKLVIVGLDIDGKQVGILRRFAQKKGVVKDILFTGAVSDYRLKQYYLNADLFITPSLFEGFGLPILEAMGAGIPVIASNNTAMPEVVGDAGILVKPKDIKGMAEAMYKILSNSKFRIHLIKKGHKRVKRFSWEKTAQGVLKVLQEVYDINQR